MMIVCIKKYLTNIWSLIPKKVNSVELKKIVAYKKSA